MNARTGWIRGAGELSGPGFAKFQMELAKYNSQRFTPALPGDVPADEIQGEAEIAQAEIKFIEAQRKELAPLTADVPSGALAFLLWFERLKETGPGQGDPLFPWLANKATLEQMRWFLSQEVAGEAGFEDLLAMTQAKMQIRAKLEMARNFWDEMGRGSANGMHGPMLERLATYLGVSASTDVVPESLALGNTMIALAKHRRYAYHSVGALGAIEMTAPKRAANVNAGLKRLGVPATKRHYFAVHSVLDVKHSKAWNNEVLIPLVEEDPRRAGAIGEGAIMRLWHGRRTFERYKREFGLISADFRAA